MQTQRIYHPNSKDLLYAIIKQAKKAGFKFRNFLDDYDSYNITSFNPETGRLVLVLKNESELKLVYDSIYLLFFDLRFAKCLFGNNWELHLQNLAISDNKLKYITNNVNIEEDE